jgi:hypothetical protein
MVAALGVSLGMARGQIDQTSSVLDGSGTRASGGTYENISAAGQPGGIAVSSGGGYVNYAGFLNTFSLQPDLDTDGDGLANEVDSDNDADGLTDLSEITGDSFSPATATEVNVADSDGDFISDGEEAVAGTDPTNLNALLELVTIENVGAGREITWTARGNNERTYVLKAAPEPGQPYSILVFSNTIAGGAAPWYETPASAIHPSASDAHVYAVEVHP